MKSVKHHMRRVLGTHLLTYEEMTTLMCQIEACLNSRPIGPLSENPEDIQALTPGHFLVGEPLVAPYAQRFEDTPDNRLRMWARIQKMAQIFWKHWKSEYVNGLQQRNKWARPEPNLKKEHIVLPAAADPLETRQNCENSHGRRRQGTERHH